jgi:hypothetical protein
MLLNEVQKQQGMIAVQAKINANQAEQIATQAAQLGNVLSQLPNMHATVVRLAAKDEFTAQR